ncbi:MAG: DNA alkylation repair protein [Candidatus Moranbacteria bacterium]|nr:DNA alkylation repair protein [Candidatus Moranbacteria bacterium]
MNQVIPKIRNELKKNIDQKYKENSKNFFKEKIKIYGVRSPIVRKIAQKYYKEISHWDKKAIFKLAEKLLQSDYNEEAIIAFDFIFRKRKDFSKQDFRKFEYFIDKYVNNWGKCDDFCTHSVGCLLERFSVLVSRNDLEKWAKAKNMWLRRAAAVSLILPVRRKMYLKKAFKIADILLLDKEDLVQKGYGWLLKEASNQFPKEVIDFVKKRKAKMPRTALRYAIEKLPNKTRRELMRRN